MDILVSDREALTNQLLLARLEARGHKLTVEPNKNAAFDQLREKQFDCILVDPAPLSEARPVIIGVWKNIRSTIKPYIILLSKTATPEDAVLAGTNDVMIKPFDLAEVQTKIGNAERLMAIHRHLAAEDNVHSGGGMVGKAAFNQLFLSAIDRAFRYGERSLVTFIHVTNYDELLAAGGTVAQDAMQKMSEKMTFMRRQSDVIGRLSDSSFGILLQRPQYESEPMDALNRFAETLEKFSLGFENKAHAPRAKLELVELPQGALRGEREAPLGDNIQLA